MLRRVAKWTTLAALTIVALGTVLYAFGLRVVWYGGGSPRLRFVESERGDADEFVLKFQKP